MLDEQIKNQLVPKLSIEDMVNQRDKLLDSFINTSIILEEAVESFTKTKQLWGLTFSGEEGKFYNNGDELNHFWGVIQYPSGDKYLRTAKRVVDIAAWSKLFKEMNILKLMDVTEKEKFQDRMKYIPEKVNSKNEIINQEEIDKSLPEFTYENVHATIEGIMLQSGEIFYRSIATAFARLDRRFKSHDGFKIGSRIIINRAFNDWGSFSYGTARDIIIDVERVFSILDGKYDSNFENAVSTIMSERKQTFGAAQSENETEYFKLRGYMNGNLHIWFKRDDLVERVNKMLAEYYGETIGDGMQAEEDPLNDNIKNTPAKNFGFFPTPISVVERVMEKFPLRNDKMRILEPSAGTGNLARPCVEIISEYYDYNVKDYVKKVYKHDVDCVEMQPQLAHNLEEEGIYRKVYCQDFLKLTPEITGLYDQIIMNPPFDRERDIDHVNHALKFLKDDGILVAIMSAGTEFRETKKSIAFRKLLDEYETTYYSLPERSFSETGTNVNTIFIQLKKKSKFKRR